MIAAVVAITAVVFGSGETLLPSEPLRLAGCHGGEEEAGREGG